MTDDRDRSEAARRLVEETAGEFARGLADVSNEELVADLAASLQPVRLRSGQVLFRTGDPADAAYLVVTGRLAAFTETPGGDATLRRLPRGSLIGEIALVDASVRTAGIKAERDSLLARLPQEGFDRLAARYPEFLRGVTGVVVERLAHPRPPVDKVTTIAVASASDRFDLATLVAAMSEAASFGGSVTQLEPVEGDAIAMDVALDEAESHHRFVFLPIGCETSEWDRRALRHADRVVVAVDRSPGDPGLVASLVGEAMAARHGEVWLVVADEDDRDEPVAAELRRRFGVDRVLRVRPGDSRDAGRLGRLATGQGIGLVLGGGGARGFAHLGVMRVLEDLGVPVDAVAGSSIGAVFAAGRALDLGREGREQVVKHGFKRVLDYTFPSVAMIKARRLSRKIRKTFGDLDLHDLRVPCIVVASNITTARLVVHETGPVVEAVRSSLAIPGVIPPVPYQGDLLVDAGVLNNLPIDVLGDSGLVGTTIAVDVAPTVGPGARHDFGLSVSGWRAFVDKWLPGPRRYPRLSTLLLRSMIVGSMRERDRLVAEGRADLYLDLDLRGISMLAFSKPGPGIERGEELARPRVEEWLASGVKIPQA
jgi:predicted acylesterase/phospholipase RssA/CRP-like cAMP-binding protein